MKQQKYVVGALNLLTIPLLVGGLVKCGSSSSTTTPANTPVTTSKTYVGSGMFIGFSGADTASTSDFDVAITKDDSTGDATSFGAGVYPKVDETNSGWGIVVPYATSATKNILFAFKANEVGTVSKAVLTTSFYDLDAKATATVNTTVLSTDETKKFTAVVAGDATQFPGISTLNGGNNLIGASNAATSKAATTTNWQTKFYTTYDGGSHGTPGGTTALFQNLTGLAPTINGTALAKQNVTFAVIKETDFAAGIYATTGAGSGGKFDAPVNGFSAKSSVSNVTNVLVVPSINGFTVATGNGAVAGICDALPSGTAGGGFTIAALPAVTVTTQNSITFKGSIWVPASATDKYPVFLLKAGGTGVKYDQNTIKLNDAALVAMIGTSSGNNTSAKLTSATTASTDVIYASATALSDGKWNPVSITISQSAANSFDCTNVSATAGALSLYLTDAAIAENATATAAKNNGIALFTGTTTTAFTTASGTNPIPSTRIRFVAQ